MSKKNENGTYTTRFIVKLNVGQVVNFYE